MFDVRRLFGSSAINQLLQPFQTPGAQSNMLMAAAQPQVQPQVEPWAGMREASPAAFVPAPAQTTAAPSDKLDPIQTGATPAEKSFGQKYQDFWASDRGQYLGDVFTGWALGSTPQESLGYGAKMGALGRATRKEKQTARDQLSINEQYLTANGYDPQSARIVAGNPSALTEAIKSIQEAGKPKKPIEINGQLVDPDTYQVVGDFRTAERPPSDVQSYQFAVSQGYPGTFADWEQQNRRAGATTINTGSNTSDFRKKSDEVAAVRLGDIVEAGNSAPQMIGDMQQLASLASQINTGRGAQALIGFGPYAQALGIDLKELGPAQAYQSIISRLAPQMRPAGSGAASDFDARQFLESLPGIGNTPEANEIINGTFQAIAQNKIDAAEIARKAQGEEITWQEAERQISKLPNPYERFKKWKPNPVDGGGVSRPTSAADYEALPSGAQFQAPDGSIRRKP